MRNREPLIHARLLLPLSFLLVVARLRRVFVGVRHGQHLP
jgi:hypothetical protein